MRRDSGATAPASNLLHSTTGHRVTGGVSGPPPFSLVNHGTGEFSSGSGAFTTWSVKADNLLVFVANANNIVNTPTDNGSNTWTLAQSIIDGNAVYIWWRIATTLDAASLTQINVSLSGANFNCLIGLYEFAGVSTSSPHDVDGQTEISAVGGNTATLTTPIVTTGASGDLAFAFVGIHDVGGTPDGGNPTWSNGFTDVFSAPRYSNAVGSAVTMYVAYLQQVPAGSINTLCTWTTGYTDRQIMVSSWKLA